MKYFSLTYRREDGEQERMTSVPGVTPLQNEGGQEAPIACAGPGDEGRSWEEKVSPRMSQLRCWFGMWVRASEAHYSACV